MGYCKRKMKRDGRVMEKMEGEGEDGGREGRREGREGMVGGTG